MKFFATAVVFFVLAFCNTANSKSLKDYYGNKLTAFKGQRKPLASPVANGIHDNYTRYKRQTPKAVQEFQNLLTKSKQECVKELGMSPTVLTKSVLHEEHPTAKEKCLMYCVLKKTKLINKSNRLCTQNVARMAGMVSNNNPLVISIAVATANKCNNFINSNNVCEAAFQINKCIAREIKTHRLKLVY